MSDLWLSPLGAGEDVRGAGQLGERREQWVPSLQVLWMKVLCSLGR